MINELALIHAMQHPFANPAGREVVVFLARWLIFVLLSYVVVLALFAKQKAIRHAAREALIAGLIGLYLALLLSGWIHRIRPFAASSDILRLVAIPLSPYALPSAHSASAFALAFPLLYAHRKYGWIAFIMAMGVGLGRVLGGVHYPTDVVCGMIVGLIAFFMVRLMHIALRRTRFIHSP